MDTYQYADPEPHIMTSRVDHTSQKDIVFWMLPTVNLVDVRSSYQSLGFLLCECSWCKFMLYGIASQAHG